MIKAKSFLRRSAIAGVAVIQTMFFPAFALAEQGTVHACPEVNGTTAPTGSSAKTFTYNPETCLWENQYYTWSPVTKKTTPRYSQEYVYNPETDRKERTIWTYSAAEGKYVRSIQVLKEPSATTSSDNDDQAESQDEQSPYSQESESDSDNPGGSNINTTGSNSSNSIDSDESNSADLTLKNGIQVTNDINSYAKSGDASVLGNTNGGSATTGDAESVANILNLLQSSWDPSNGDIAMFNADIYDYHGDLLFDPSTILNTGADSTNQIEDDQKNKLDVNIENDGRIVNNVDLTAESGDATVANNTKAGDATTGDAHATANIFNLINSMVSPVNSLIATINILGSLNGDILLPMLLNSISETGANSQNTISEEQDTQTNITSASNRSVTNNTDLSAESGDASVSNNTSGGSASTGDAQTNLNIYNMTGQEVLGTHGLLVFTNVLGYWDGFLLDGARGENNIFGTGPDSVQAVNSSSDTELNVDSTTNSAIENNVNLKAKSGDANVTGNTKAGDATTGDATASANVVNLINSELDFSDWFGVLFINVFGDWVGSFGRDTDAGESVAAKEDEQNTGADSNSTDKKSKSQEKAEVQGFAFANTPPDASSTATAGSTSAATNSNQIYTGLREEASDNTDGEVLAANVSNPTAGNSEKPADNPAVSLTTLGVIAGATLLALERWLTFRSKKQQA